MVISFVILSSRLLVVKGCGIEFKPDNVFGLGRDLETIIQAPAADPDDGPIRFQDGDAPFLHERNLFVNKEIAHLFPGVHAKGDKPVSVLPETEQEMVAQFFGIDKLNPST